MTNGEYTNKWADLTLDFGVSSQYTPNIIFTKAGTFSLTKNNSGDPDGVKGESSYLPGARLQVGWEHSYWKGKWACQCNKNNERMNRLCKSISHKNTHDSSGQIGDDVWYYYFFA